MGDRIFRSYRSEDIFGTGDFYKYFTATRLRTRAQGEKCERCWNYSTRVGESSRYPTVCERCVAALEEIETAEELS